MLGLQFSLARGVDLTLRRRLLVPSGSKWFL